MLFVRENKTLQEVPWPLKSGAFRPENRCEIRIDPFFYWFLNSTSYWEWVRSTFIQSTIQNISADRYANLWIAHSPEKAEQRQIVDFIESSCAGIDNQCQMITRSVQRLEEYRSALITAAVTGQIGGLK